MIRIALLPVLLLTACTPITPYTEMYDFDFDASTKDKEITEVRFEKLGHYDPSCLVRPLGVTNRNSSVDTWHYNLEVTETQYILTNISIEIADTWHPSYKPKRVTFKNWLTYKPWYWMGQMEAYFRDIEACSTP